MPATYFWPNRATLTAIAADLVLGIQATNPIFQFVFPIKPRNDIMLQWYVDENISGLMALRGAGGAPVKVDPEGRTYFETEPGVFGEWMGIDEIELMKLGRGIPNDMSIAVDVSDRVRQHQNTLMVREKNRMRQMGWTVGRLGNIAIPLPGGGIGYRENYTIQTRTVSPLWSNLATGKPLADLQANQQLYGIGTSNNWGSTATALMNSYTRNLIINNLNPADWGGRHNTQGSTLKGMGDYDELRLGLELPRIIVWDEGYLDASKTFQLDIPNGEILIVANRGDGTLPGEFSMTYNAVSKAPGAYTDVFDYTGGERKEIPPRLEVHAGFNGGIVLHRPTQLLRMIVA